MPKKSRVNADKPTTIYFIRHGQPDNPKKLIKGAAPFKLSNLGRKKIRIQAKRLRPGDDRPLAEKKEKIAAIFSSPILRCRQTAEIVAEVLNEGNPSCEVSEWTPRRWDGKKAKPILQRRAVSPQGVKIRTTTYLTEWTGSLDGKPEKEAKKLPLAKYNAAFEPQAKVLKRMNHFVKMILEKYPGQKVIAVSHQGPIDLLLFSVQGKDTSQMPGKDLVTGMGEIVKAEFNHSGQLISIQRFKNNSQEARRVDYSVSTRR